MSNRAFLPEPCVLGQLKQVLASLSSTLAEADRLVRALSPDSTPGPTVNLDEFLSGLEPDVRSQLDPRTKVRLSLYAVDGMVHASRDDLRAILRLLVERAKIELTDDG